jgi:hypothetical protein
VSVFWADANLDAINEAVGATRKRGGRRAMTANFCRMPPVVTPVNGAQLDGRHVCATASGRCLAALQCLSYRLLAIEISVAHLALHLDEKPILAFSLFRSRRGWTAPMTDVSRPLRHDLSCGERTIRESIEEA